MVTFTQLLVLTACTVGILAFVYVNWFTYRGLRREQKRADLEDQFAEGLTFRNEDPDPQLEQIDLQRREEALFYMHQEQVRRLFDAKLDLIRSSADTQNKISLIQAEVVRLRAERDVRAAESGRLERPDDYLALEHQGADPPAAPSGSGGSASATIEPTGGTDVVDAEVVDAPDAAAPRRAEGDGAATSPADDGATDELDEDIDAHERMIELLKAEHERQKTETEQRLAELDQQIRTLPGISVDGWVRSQSQSTKD